MARLVPRLALALVGSGALTRLHVDLAVNRAQGPWKEMSSKRALVSISGWWVALASALVFALAPQRRVRERAFVVSMSAGAFTVTSALLGTILELAASHFYATETFRNFVNTSFMFLKLATPLALLWRAWRGE